VSKLKEAYNVILCLPFTNHTTCKLYTNQREKARRLGSGVHKKSHKKSLLKGTIGNNFMRYLFNGFKCEFTGS
jgi:hypothetical protein